MNIRTATIALKMAIFATCVIAPSMTMAEPAAVMRGAAAVEQWCRLCHLRETDPPKPGMGPPFEQIVQRPNRTRAYFANFMKNDHFPMTTFRLFDHEKTDVIAYLDWLSKNRN